VVCVQFEYSSLTGNADIVRPNIFTRVRTRGLELCVSLSGVCHFFLNDNGHRKFTHTNGGAGIRILITSSSYLTILTFNFDIFVG
jgi:hypothetical protein